jgi:hypothetical protein
MASKAVVVLSGGQDSTTCLFWALDRFGDGEVEALTFDYGQRHRIELECAAMVAEHAAVAHTTLPIDTFAALGGNALTDAGIQVEDAADNGLPNTFVPGRRCPDRLLGLPGLQARNDRRTGGNAETGHGTGIYDSYSVDESFEEANGRTGTGPRRTGRHGVDAYLLQRTTPAMRRVPCMPASCQRI